MYVRSGAKIHPALAMQTLGYVVLKQDPKFLGIST
jgi:hypothetical protein